MKAMESLKQYLTRIIQDAVSNAYYIKPWPAEFIYET